MQRMKQKAAVLAVVCLVVWAPAAWAAGAPEIPGLLAQVRAFGAQIFEAVGLYLEGLVTEETDPSGVTPEAEQDDLMGVIVPFG